MANGKPILWIIGASDYNLGMTIANQAIINNTYGLINTTDEVACDVQDSDSVNRRVRDIAMASTGEDIDIVYCAGVNFLDAIEVVDDSDLWTTYMVNVVGFIKVLRAVVNEWPGRPVNVVAIASDAARTPMRNSIAYCSSKAALVQAVRCAARELAPHVRVNAVSPAIIEHTPMTTNIDAAVQLQRGWSEEEALEYERKLIPMGRRATKEEVAQVVLQTLAGPQFMTGSNIEITGGK